MINHYKSPKDKISTLINFCNILSAMLINNNKNIISKNKNLAGADEVMPIVVYSLLMGNIPKIKSNLKYIRLFRHHSMFDANKEEYFTTMIESAVEFIDKLNCESDLKIEKKELKKIIQQKEKEIFQRKIIEPIQHEKKNADENFLVYFLTENTDRKEESSILPIINDDPIEMNEFKSNSVQTNTSSTISKELLKEQNGLMNIDLNKLYEEYFTKDLKEMPIRKIDKMVNDFKITLALLDNYSKANYEQTAQSLSQNNGPYQNNNIFDNSKNVIN
jgi:hypothetical protein